MEGGLGAGGGLGGRGVVAGVPDPGRGILLGARRSFRCHRRGRALPRLQNHPIPSLNQVTGELYPSPGTDTSETALWWLPRLV